MSAHCIPRWLGSVAFSAAAWALLALPHCVAGDDGCKSAGATPAAEAPVGCRLPEVWLISTRCMGCEESAYRFYRYDACGDPTASTVEDFLASSNEQVSTVFYAHGAANSESDALEGAWRAMPRLASPSGRPLRFVIWSWPADRTHLRPIHDMREQADVSYHEGLKMAHLIDRMPAQSPICLLGFSFGAHVTGGAAHVLGGGTLAGRQLTSRVHPDRRPMRMVLISGGVDNNWLMPGCPFDKALVSLERLLVFVNPCDRVLKRYGRIDPCDSAQAMGYSGVAGLASLGPAADKITQTCSTPWVGKRHEWVHYIDSGILEQRVRAFAAFEDR